MVDDSLPSFPASSQDSNYPAVKAQVYSNQFCEVQLKFEQKFDIDNGKGNTKTAFSEVMSSSNQQTVKLADTFLLAGGDEPTGRLSSLTNHNGARIFL